MDTDIDELKELVRVSNKLAEDTNKVVHSMRRAQRVRSILGFVWWAAILGVTGYVYYTFLWPQLEQVMQFYGSAQDIFQNFRPQ